MEVNELVFFFQIEWIKFKLHQHVKTAHSAWFNMLLHNGDIYRQFQIYLLIN